MASSLAKIADLDNQYGDDRVLRRYLERVLPPTVRTEIEPELRDLGAFTGGPLYDLQLEDRPNEPSLTRFGPQGERIDHIELTEVWEKGLEAAAEYGVIGTAYEQEHGAYSRIDQFARAYLLAPGTDMLGFLLATTDGTARTLIDLGPDDLTREVVPHLVSRDPEAFWTSGQWRTEKAGGTDLSRIETTARRDGDGTWRLHGHKWFTSSTAANVALVLARAERVGQQEAGTISTQERHLLYALAPIAKLTTAKQATSVLGKVMEAFGGGGYVEDTGIPALLRDAYALPLWEGTTNVMALTTLQKLRREGRFEALKAELERCADAVESPELVHALEEAQDAFENATTWLAEALEDGEEAMEAGARRFALTLGHVFELALLARHAQWALSGEGSRAAAVVEHFAAQGVDHIAPRRHYGAYLLAQDLSTQSLFVTPEMAQNGQ
jgi:hypothetical protein